MKLFQTDRKHKVTFSFELTFDPVVVPFAEVARAVDEHIAQMMGDGFDCPLENVTRLKSGTLIPIPEGEEIAWESAMDAWRAKHREQREACAVAADAELAKWKRENPPPAHPDRLKEIQKEKKDVEDRGGAAGGR